jgi:putative aldouronate transport system permease protein
MPKKSLIKTKFDLVDLILFVLLTLWGFVIFLPFLNMVAISFTSYKEYLESPLLIFPKTVDFKAYKEIFQDNRVWNGYRNTFFIILIGVPLSLFLCSTAGYALSRGNFPGRRIVFYLILFTMIFNGGIVPLYLVVRSLKLTNTLWSVILTGAMNTFYMILMYNFFSTLPESLVESAKLDGAGDWTIMFKIILPLSLPIIATLTLFFTVDKWNEYFNAMIFIRRGTLQPLQTVLRAIVIDAQTSTDVSASFTQVIDRTNTQGIKMAAVMVTMVPIMCIYPFLQKHFAKGILIGAIKA